MSSTGRAVAEFDGVSKCYPGRGAEVWAVRGVDLRLDAGEVVGLVGPNRAGKTTLAKLLLSICRPTAGRVSRLGRPADDRSTLARVGYAHEDAAFPRDLTASGLLRFYGALTFMPRSDIRRRAGELLERVGLSDRRREPIGRFSKGMLRRLALAQALLNDPELLVLDEPAEGLDLDGRGLVRGLVAERRERGGTVLLISHDPPDVARLCNRVVVLAEGRKAHDGPIAGAGPDGSKERAIEGLLRGSAS